MELLELFVNFDIRLSCSERSEMPCVKAETPLRTFWRQKSISQEGFKQNCIELNVICNLGISLGDVTRFFFDFKPSPKTSYQYYLQVICTVKCKRF